MTPAPAAPWPVVVTLEPCHSQHVFQHPEPVITIPCPSHPAMATQSDRLTWLELLGQR
jgi:hypothetical protein